MRPGKPLLYGRMGHQRVLGVPGNPVSALICGLVFLAPMLHRLLGLREGARGRAEAVLGQDLDVMDRVSITCGLFQHGALTARGSLPPSPSRTAR